MLCAREDLLLLALGESGVIAVLFECLPHDDECSSLRQQANLPSSAQPITQFFKQSVKLSRESRKIYVLPTAYDILYLS